MEAKTLQNNKSRTAFLMAVARGRKWQRDIDEGKVRDIKELTEILQLDHSYVSRILRRSEPCTVGRNTVRLASWIA